MNKLYEVLEICLNEIEQGTDVDTVLFRYPDLANELRPILEASVKAKGMAVPAPSQEVVRRNRAKLLQHAAQMREQKSVIPARRIWSVPLRRALVTLMMVAMMFVSGNGLVRASSTTLPGDNLYPVKRTWEGFQLFFTFDVTERETLELEHENERLEELRELISKGRSSPVEFSGYVTSQAGSEWQIDGVKVVVSLQTKYAPAFSQRFYRTPTNQLATPDPAPTGPYAVGTLSKLLTNTSRTNAQFMTIFWYPAVAQAGVLPAKYVESQVALCGYYNFTRYGGGNFGSQVTAFFSHALSNAPIATNLAKYPVVLYDPGGWGHRRENTDKAEDLASWGYVVIGLDTSDTWATRASQWDSGDQPAQFKHPPANQRGPRGSVAGRTVCAGSTAGMERQRSAPGRAVGHKQSWRFSMVARWGNRSPTVPSRPSLQGWCRYGRVLSRKQLADATAERSLSVLTPRQRPRPGPTLNATGRSSGLPIRSLQPARSIAASRWKVSGIPALSAEMSALLDAERAQQ